MLAVTAANLADTVQIDDLYLNFIIGALVPLLVGLVTRLNASAGLKAVMNFGFSAIVGAGTQLLDGGSMTGKELIVKIATTWITSIVAYTGLQKPTGMAGTVANLLPNVGIGHPKLETEDVGLEDLSEDSLWNKHVDELQEIAKGLHIKGRTRMVKDELIKAILAAKEA